MEYKNNINNFEIYKAVMPTRLRVEEPKISHKKVLACMIGAILIACCLGVYSNYEELQLHLPEFSLNSSASGTQHVYPRTNHSIPKTIINTNLLNPMVTPVGVNMI